MSLTFNVTRKVFDLRSSAFELIHRTGWKEFLHSSVPESYQHILLERHIIKKRCFPTIFSIEITNVCNAKCWFCPQPQSKRKKGYMDFSLFQKIMDEISKNYRGIKGIALFMDGEPSLHPHLVEFLKYAHNLGVGKINISSNMEYFTPRLTDAILSANLGKTLQYVICSLDGINKSVYRKNRIDIDFDKALHNTEYLIARRDSMKKFYPWVFPRLLVSDLTENDVDKFIKYWKGKADKVLCYPMHNWGENIIDKRIQMKNVNGRFYSCYFPFSQFAIQYDGSVRLCCVDANETVIIGNVREDTIEGIWNGDAINRIRTGHLSKILNRVPSICTKCSYPQKGTWIAPFYW